MKCCNVFTVRLWASKDELKAYIQRIEEAEKRDHRKLGKQLDLFHLQDEAPGMVFWHPKGWALWQVIEQHMRKELNAAGYKEVKTPQIMDKPSGKNPATGKTIKTICL